MFQDFKESLRGWKASTTERQKLQHSYLFIAVLGVLIAGLISLVNSRLGHRLAYIALLALAAFIANSFIWHLLNSVVLTRLPTRTKKK